MGASNPHPIVNLGRPIRFQNPAKELTGQKTHLETPSAFLLCEYILHLEDHQRIRLVCQNRGFVGSRALLGGVAFPK